MPRKRAAKPIKSNKNMKKISASVRRGLKVKKLVPSKRKKRMSPRAPTQPDRSGYGAKFMNRTPKSNKTRG